jgi:hypothetical protein
MGNEPESESRARERDGHIEQPAKLHERDGHIEQPAKLHERDEHIEQPAKLLRITQMVRTLLDEARQSPLDESTRKRLRGVYENSVRQLKDALSEDLQRELEAFVVPFDKNPSESEIRVAQAQLVGWLEGLLQGIQAALWAHHLEAQAQLQEMRRRSLPEGRPELSQDRDGHPAVGQYL